MKDDVNHPTHYNSGKIEVIEFIEDQKLGFHLGNAVKYISRAGKKDPTKLVQDLEKAIWYIRRRLELEKENPRRPNDMGPERWETCDHDFMNLQGPPPESKILKLCRRCARFEHWIIEQQKHHCVHDFLVSEIKEDKTIVEVCRFCGERP